MSSLASSSSSPPSPSPSAASSSASSASLSATPSLATDGPARETADADLPAVPTWPDTHALYERFAALVNQPMRPIRPDAMPKVLRWFDEHCAGSKRLAERAATVIPGGVQHNLAFNHPFPLAIAQARG